MGAKGRGARRGTGGRSWERMGNQRRSKGGKKRRCFAVRISASLLKCLILMVAAVGKNPTMIRVTLSRGRDLSERALWSLLNDLSGPVLRDTARLSQRYPPIARYGVFGVSTWPIGCDTPSPFSERFPPWRACKVEVRYPPQKGYLSDTCAIPYENKANGCDTPLCDTISKGYCAIGGGVSRTGPLSE